MASSAYLDVLKDRVLVYDGAMGTSIQALGLTAADFGGPELEGCNDHLVLSRPDVVEEIHASYLEVGCDVVETNTFRANQLTMREYGLEDRIVELNRTAAALARRAADRFSTPERPRFVAGSIGPSGSCRARRIRRWAPSPTTSWRRSFANRRADSSRAASTCCSSRRARTCWR